MVHLARAQHACGADLSSRPEGNPLSVDTREQRAAGISAPVVARAACLSAGAPPPPPNSSPPALINPSNHQVMGMPGMVLTVAESLRLSTPMTFDALTFVILRKLSAAKRKLKVGRGEAVPSVFHLPGGD